MEQIDAKKLRLVTAWLICQGVKVTPKNLIKNSFLSTEQLERMLAARGIFFTTIKN
jgi:hypothetical protein